MRGDIAYHRGVALDDDGAPVAGPGPDPRDHQLLRRPVSVHARLDQPRDGHLVRRPGERGVLAVHARPAAGAALVGSGPVAAARARTRVAGVDRHGGQQPGVRPQRGVGLQRAAVGCERVARVPARRGARRVDRRARRRAPTDDRASSGRRRPARRPRRVHAGADRPLRHRGHRAARRRHHPAPRRQPAGRARGPRYRSGRRAGVRVVVDPARGRGGPERPPAARQLAVAPPPRRLGPGHPQRTRRRRAVGGGWAPRGLVGHRRATVLRHLAAALRADRRVRRTAHGPRCHHHAARLVVRRDPGRRDRHRRRRRAATRPSNRPGARGAHRRARSAEHDRGPAHA